MQLEQKKVNNIEKLVVTNLERALRCEVISPEKLREMPSFKDVEAAVQVNQPLATSHKAFNKFIISDKSLFPFTHSADLREFLHSHTPINPFYPKFAEMRALICLLFRISD